jgi:iodotyrosine deiodinase
MGFLAQVLGRPANEKPFLLLSVGYPAEDAEVPNVTKKLLSGSAILVK